MSVRRLRHYFWGELFVQSARWHSRRFTRWLYQRYLDAKP